MQNTLILCEAVPATVSSLFGRPFQVIHGDRFARALDDSTTDLGVRALPPFFGNTTQWADSTDVPYPVHAPTLARVYGA